MSSVAASLCLFSAALCNVKMLDQKLFEPQGMQQQGGESQTIINQATNLFGNIANQGLGLLTGNRQRQGQNQGQPQNQKQRVPHQSPCPGKFQYVTDGREWKGIIRMKNIDLNHDTTIFADFVLPQEAYIRMKQSGQEGRIGLVNQGESIYEDVSNGLPLLFEVIFPSQNPVPKFIALYKNKREICSGPIETQTGLAQLRLKYHLKSSITSLNGETEDRFNLEGHHHHHHHSEEQHHQQQQPNHQQQQPHNQHNQQQPNHQQQPNNHQQPQPQPQQQPQGNPKPVNPQSVNQFQDDNAVCGIPVAGFTQSLVIGGQAAGHGEWPWLVAFYRSTKGNLEFICGGSLISSTYTVSAAHCIQDKGKTEPLQTQDALLFIGKHNLIQWNEEGYEKKGVKTFKVHPEWDPTDIKYDADISLIEMESPVRYSKFIRPICLWNGPDEIAKVVGQAGIVVGWGKNDDGQLNTDFPKKVNVPIVSDGQCLRTHEAFVHITSERTFCAGGRMGEGPCQGDSGGGLVLKKGKKWFLRGIVSASLRDGASCDVNSYAIFTDIVKFMPWIKGQMQG